MSTKFEKELLTERVDSAIDEALKEERIVGTVVTVMHKGERIYERAAGFADRENGVQTRKDQIFRFASVTKVVTALTAMVLVEQGRLGLDDDVSQWLPYFQPAMPDGEKLPVTVRHLLTMTCGLSYGITPESRERYKQAGVSNGIDSQRIDLDEAMLRLSNAGLFARPGEKWEYSLGLDVLGAVIAKVTGRTFPQAVRELITDKLGIVDTGFELVDPTRLAVPYASGDIRPKRMGDIEPVEFPGFGTIVFEPNRVFLSDAFPSGGGGMVGTGQDMALIMDQMCRGGGKLMNRETASATMSNQIGDLETLLGPGWAWGFGAAVLTDPEKAQSPQGRGTFQWSGAYGNTWFVDPENELTVVSMTNTAPEGDLGLFPIMIRDAVYDAETEISDGTSNWNR